MPVPTCPVFTRKLSAATRDRVVKRPGRAHNGNRGRIRFLPHRVRRPAAGKLGETGN